MPNFLLYSYGSVILTLGFSMQQIVEGGLVDGWACLNFSRNNDDTICKFTRTLVGKCQNMGMVLFVISIFPLLNSSKAKYFFLLYFLKLLILKSYLHFFPRNFLIQILSITSRSIPIKLLLHFKMLPIILEHA